LATLPQPPPSRRAPIVAGSRDLRTNPDCPSPGFHRRSGPAIRNAAATLLGRRADRQRDFDAGVFPTFLANTAEVREGDWRVAPIARDLLDRRVEITGPVDRRW